MPNSETPNLNPNIPAEFAKALDRARGEKVAASAFEEIMKEEARLEQEIAEKEQYLQTLLSKQDELSRKSQNQTSPAKNIDSFVESIKQSAEESLGKPQKPARDIGGLPAGWDKLPKISSDRLRTTSEKPTHVATETYHKSKNNHNFRDAVNSLIALTLTGAIAISGFFGIQQAVKNKQKTKPPTRPSTEANAKPTHEEIPETPKNSKEEDGSVIDGAEDIYLSDGIVASFSNGTEFNGKASTKKLSPAESMSSQEIFAMMAKSPEFRHGLIDGYNKEGLWTSTNKPSNIAFASASELSGLFQNDEVEMLCYTAANQTESFADYLACLPEAIKPSLIKGLNIEEVSQLLESTDDHSYRVLQTYFNNLINQAYIRRTTLNGRYHNAYMALKDSSGPLTHENMELVSCISDEYGTEVTEFYWVDKEGHETGSMLVKMTPVYDNEGNITSFKGCMQAVTPAGSHIYDGLPSVKPPAPQPETPPDTPPRPIPIVTPPAPKDPENLTRIDDQILEDISEDTGGGEVVVTPTDTVSEDLTSQSTDTSHEDTSPPNEASAGSETVAPTNPADDYSENQGGAHDSEYSPVQPNEPAQAAGEIPISEAPTGTEVNDILADIGIH